MQGSHIERRAILPLALALAGALFAAFAMMVGADKSASALTNCTVSHAANDGEELAFLGLINNYRQQNGLGTLTISTNLNQGSAWMTEDMAKNNYFAHTDSLGRSPYARAIDCGYPTGAGENLAAGGAWSSAAAAFQAWQNSPGHNSNMLGQYYQQIGIARYYSADSQYGWYWATTFGAVNDGTGGGGAGPTSTPTTVPATSTNTPAQPTQGLPTSTATPNQGGGGQPSPTQPLATSTPTQTPNQGGSGQASPTPALPTSTPTQKAATATPTSTNTPVPTATKPPSSTATPTSPGSSLALSPGANLVAWPSGSMAPSEAFKGNTTVSVVYEWDPISLEWKRYFPGLPDYLNNLKSMKQGGAYWVIAKTQSTLTFGP